MIWSKGQRWRLFNEILLLITAAPMALVYYSQGTLVFVLLIGLVGAQAIRHWQIQRTQRSLIGRVQELSILNDMAQSISSSLDLNEMLTSFYITLQKLGEIPISYVALYQEEHGIFNFPLVMEHGKKQLWGTVVETHHPTFAHIIRHKTPLHVTAPDSIHELGHPQLSTDYHAYLGLPLMVGDKLLGIWGFADTKAIYLLEKIGVPTLNTIASQLSLALRNANLYARTTKVANDLEKINQITQVTSQTSDQSDALDVACHITLQIAQADKVAIFLLSEDKKEVRLACQYGLNPQLMSLYKQVIDEKALVRDPVLIHDAHLLDAESEEGRYAAIGGYRALAKIPLKSANVTMGMIMVYHQQAHYYHQTEIELLMALANQLAVAHDNVELLRALEMYGWEQAQLVYLSDISTSTLDVETIILNVTRILQYSIESDWCNLVLAPQYQKQVDFTSLTPPKADLFLIPEFIHLQARKGTNITVYRKTNNNISAGLDQFMTHNMLGVLFTAPLITNNRTIGILMIGHYADKALTESKQRLLEMAANQIATQLHNAILYQQTQRDLIQRMKQLSLIETIAQQISASLNRERLIRNVLQAAINASGADLAALALVTNQNTLHILHMHRVNDEWRDYEVVTDLQDGLVGKVIQTGVPMIVANNLRERGYVSPHPNDNGDTPTFLSSVLVPLIQDQKTIGVLNVESHAIDFFTEEHLEFFKSLGGHTIISIQNANLLAERQQQIEQISAHNNQLQAILDSTRDGVILLNRDGMLMKANRSAEELLRVSLHDDDKCDFIELLWNEYGLENDRENQSLAQTLTEIRRILRSEPDMLTTNPFEIHRDGQVRHIRMVGSPVRDSQNYIIGRLLTLHDITEERLLAKYRQNITRMMVHDLRGPLGSVISGINFAISLITDNMDPTISEVLNISLNNAQDLLELVENILDIYKLQAGQLPLKLGDIDLNSIVNAAHSALSASMQEAQITFKYDISPTMPRLYVDSNIIRRVLINLLDNAVRYSPTGGEVLLIAKHTYNNIEIQIADSGSGIPLAEQDRIFDEFHQIKDNAPKRGSKGSGLGLTFCKLAIEAHGGTIQIAPHSPLSGACFVITLPLIRHEIIPQTAEVSSANV
jgi:K+-sensing histidine kinase KdpD